ncbi:MAG: hypothetical protein KBC17_00480 [Candidatus Pacebacteria bacterium]|nr:hypothetical protein [Candidatus Paceibacterota bacterium]
MNIGKNKVLGFTATLATIFALVASPILATTAYAASVTAFSVQLEREKASTATNMTITFTVPAAIASGETIILTFDNSTSTGSVAYTDIDISDDGADLTINGTTPSGGDWGVVNTSSTVLTFTNGTTAVGAGSVVVIEIGTNATFGVTGVNKMTNGSAGTSTLVLSGTMGTPDMTGTAAMAIIDDDQVTVTASVASTISFDLDAATDFSNGESATPYNVALGTISPSAVKVSDTSTVAMIVVEGSTNASGGMAVTVNNVNGANGLVSTSVSGDDIDSATGTMAAGTENYGLCIATSGLVGWTRATGYVSDTCALSSGTNQIRTLNTTPTAFLNSGSAPLASTAHAEVVVNAAVSATTVAHADYTDTLTFIATATF